MKYQLNAQARFHIQNDKAAIWEGLYATLAIFTLVVQPESHRGELKTHQLAVDIS